MTKEITPWEPLPQAADNTSTYSAHYQNWPVQPRRRTRPQDERPQTAHRFDSRSTMQDSYQNWRGNLASKSCRPQSAYEPKEFSQPISTTHREAFRQWTTPKQAAFKPKLASDPPGYTPTGRTTMQDSYQPIMRFVASKSAKPIEKLLDVTPFEGTTTSRASYQPWPMPQGFRGRPQEPLQWMGQGDHPIPQSTYRDMFREITIRPSAKSAVGVQVVGGKFYTMLPRGTRPPAEKKVMMTTTTNRQTSMDIVILQTGDQREREGSVLGEFTLEGIAPSRAGVPQVEVTFFFSTDNQLRVSANDLQGQRTRALSVKNRVFLG